MSVLFRERITQFLKAYVTLPERSTDCEGRAGISAIKQSLCMIVTENILSAEQITKELLAFDIMLPSYRIGEWVNEFKPYMPQ